MATLKETAHNYITPQTMNISELSKISVDIVLLDGEGLDKDTNKPYTYKFAEIDGKRYKVPGPVIGQLKNILSRFPNTKYVSVLKEGQGKATKYQVIPLSDQ